LTGSAGQHSWQALAVNFKVSLLPGNLQLRLREVVVQGEGAANHRGGSRENDNAANGSDTTDDLACK